MITIFRWVLLGKIGVRFFSGGHVFNENKLKSEIFNEKKCLLTKMFSSVSLNPEFNYFKKMGWGLRIKKFIYYGGSLKNLIFRVGSQKENNIQGGFSKKGGLGQFVHLRGGLAKKGNGVIVGGLYRNAHHGKLNYRLTSFFLGVKLQKAFLICTRFIEGSQEIQV